MALLIVELVSSTPVAVLPTHKKEELAGFLNTIPPYAKRKINEVVIDLNQGYNVVIKLLKRISFGMRNPELYAKKIMLGPAP